MLYRKIKLVFPILHSYIQGQLMHDAHRADEICIFSNNNVVHYAILFSRPLLLLKYFTLGHRDDVLHFMNDSFVASLMQLVGCKMQRRHQSSPPQGSFEIGALTLCNTNIEASTRCE